MTKTERKIAEIILCNPAQFITHSLAELAAKAGVSQGSIINFSKKYVDGGFPDLKIMVSACLGTFSENPMEVVSGSDSISDALNKNAASFQSAHGLTAALNDEETLMQAVQMILDSSKIEIYGVFTSAAIATIFYYQLLQLGIPVTFVGDILTCSMTAVMLDKSSLVIAISSSGRTRDIIDAAKHAKDNNVPIIAITSNAASPLAKLADNVLIASPGGTSINNSPMEVHTSMLLLIDTICSYIRSRSGEEAKKRYRKLATILSSHNVEEGENE